VSKRCDETRRDPYYERPTQLAIEKRSIQTSSDDGIPAATQPLVSESSDESGGEPFFAVMQVVDLRDGDEFADPRWLYQPRVWRILRWVRVR
jgi:hypothetical protein